MVKKEPVMTSAVILAFTSALLSVLMEMGWVELTPDQFQAWLTFFSAATVLAGLVVRQFVTPYIKDE